MTMDVDKELRGEILMTQIEGGKHWAGAVFLVIILSIGSTVAEDPE